MRFRLAAALLVLVAFVKPAFALDPFEIRVYDGTALPEGKTGVRLHANFVPAAARAVVAPELSAFHVTHLLVESAVGVTPWFELGAYFAAAAHPADARSEARLDYGGTKLRGKFVAPRRVDDRFRYALNLELSFMPSRYDADVFTATVRPIIAYEDAWLLAAINAGLVAPLGALQKGVRFAPSATAFLKFLGWAGVGFEYYGDFGVIGAPLARREQPHYVYGVFHLLGVRNLELSVGVGEGFTPASNGWTVKTIIGYVPGR